MRGAGINALAFAVPYIIIAVGVFLALSFVGMVGYLIYYYTRNATSPIVRVSAVVLRKRHRQHDITIDSNSGPGLHPIDDFIDAVTPGSGEILLGQTADFFITFGFDGREQEFQVPQSLYTTPEDTEGLLVYKGDRFKHFIPGANRDLW